MQLSPEIIEEIVRSVPRRAHVIPGYVPSAVMMLFFNRGPETYLVYIRRTKGMNLHSGQMAFPGGKIEPNESSYAAAVRETLEEIGVPESEYRHLGDMGYFETLTSRYDAVAHLAWCPNPPTYQPSAREVAAVVEIPISVLRAQFRPDLDFSNYDELIYLNFRYRPEGHSEVTLWGLTARITHHFLSGLTRSSAP